MRVASAHIGVSREASRLHKVLEGAEMKLASIRRTDRPWQRSSRACRRFGPDDPDLVDTLERLDTELHHRIAEATHNPLLVRVMRSLLDLLSESRKRSLGIPGQGLKSVRFHAAITRAITRQDARGAARAMREHLEDVLRAVTRPRGGFGKTRAATPG